MHILIIVSKDEFGCVINRPVSFAVVSHFSTACMALD